MAETIVKCDISDASTVRRTAQREDVAFDPPALVSQ